MNALKSTISKKITSILFYHLYVCKKNEIRKPDKFKMFEEVITYIRSFCEKHSSWRIEKNVI